MNTPEEPLRTAMAQAAYYARRAGYLEGALLVISWGTSGVDPQEAAKRALDAAGEDEYARRLRGSTVERRFCEPTVAGSTPAAGFAFTGEERRAIEHFAREFKGTNAFILRRMLERA